MTTLALESLGIFKTVVDEGGVVRAAEKMDPVPFNVTTRVRQHFAISDLGVACVERLQQTEIQRGETPGRTPAKAARCVRALSSRIGTWIVGNAVTLALIFFAIARSRSGWIIRFLLGDDGPRWLALRSGEKSSSRRLPLWSRWHWGSSGH